MVDVRIRNISDSRMEELKNISAHYGLTVPAFIKMKIIETINSTPDHIKSTKKEKSED